MAEHRINWSKYERKNGDRIRQRKHNGQEFSKIMKAIKSQNQGAPKNTQQEKYKIKCI